MQDFLKYSKERLDKSHHPPDFKVGDLVLVSILSFNKIKGPKEVKDSFARAFIIGALHFTNAVQLELTGELMNKNSNLPISLMKTYSSRNKKLFPLRNKPPLEIPPLKEGEEVFFESPEDKEDKKTKKGNTL
ncbi:hypothetical protein O181_062660 [Austropuccinia psidii MF-1]|uniref:Uncharacterized protein n=1 Tax=Austropuccinia psidii MF-1 TaxID=1389203 RepID=A0A9Q3EHD5_9BASI|nr:hypothetical protein [Austropuccinia psidii MF-1]